MNKNTLRDILLKQAEKVIAEDNKYIKELQKENIELKSKLENIRYFDRGEVEKIIDDMIAEISGTVGFYRCHQATESNYYKLAVKRICQLAIKEEDIIEV